MASEIRSVVQGMRVARAVARVGVLKRQDATAREQGLIFVAKEKVAIKLEEDKSISEVQSEAIMVWHLLSW